MSKYRKFNWPGKLKLEMEIKIKRFKKYYTYQNIRKNR